MLIEIAEIPALRAGPEAMALLADMQRGENMETEMDRAMREYGEAAAESIKLNAHADRLRHEYDEVSHAAQIASMRLLGLGEAVLAALRKSISSD